MREEKDFQAKIMGLEKLLLEKDEILLEKENVMNENDKLQSDNNELNVKLVDLNSCIEANNKRLLEAEGKNERKTAENQVLKKKNSEIEQ